MPPSAVWVPLVIFIGTSGVALAIAHLQRKQMRQIELHRADPSVPLEPPPGPVARFLKRNSFVFTFGTLNFLSLLHELFEKRPLDRFEVFIMASVTAGLLITFVSHIQFRTVEAMMRLDRETWDVLKRHNEAITLIRELLRREIEADERAAGKQDSPAQTSDSPQPEQLEAPKS